jgi:hypothetical protein
VVRIAVTLGSFAREGVEDHFGSDVAAGVRAAVRSFTRRLSTGCPPRFPSYPDAFVRSGGGAGVEVEVETRDEIALSGFARNRGVGMRDLVRHAVLVYLADLEALEVSPRCECDAHRHG